MSELSFDQRWSPARLAVTVCRRSDTIAIYRGRCGGGACARQIRGGQNGHPCLLPCRNGDLHSSLLSGLRGLFAAVIAWAKNGRHISVELLGWFCVLSLALMGIGFYGTMGHRFGNLFRGLPLATS